MKSINNVNNYDDLIFIWFNHESTTIDGDILITLNQNDTCKYLNDVVDIFIKNACRITYRDRSYFTECFYYVMIQNVISSKSLKDNLKWTIKINQRKCIFETKSKYSRMQKIIDFLHEKTTFRPNFFLNIILNLVFYYIFTNCLKNLNTLFILKIFEKKLTILPTS
ncbi:hypothetical protein RFI_23565 [Reticulomyxa filosa]|uniref:Uncharacterized protein n=1 Tax=Reticulomyxa filosa TaxID=46433 RepID=X6MIV3_RETFI|nr:hypothetical protein RFI_23565 [Reticulomyxa filosa]|eukprot:ETO13804.1 hypothetical protein RFI_23565 [Reticulomyxa filosa]